MGGSLNGDAAPTMAATRGAGKARSVYLRAWVGGDVATRSFAVLKPGGRAAFIASGAQAPKPERSDVVSLRPAVGRDRPHLERILELRRVGAVRAPHVTSYSLAQAAEALGVSAARHLKGKLVLKVR